MVERENLFLVEHLSQVKDLLMQGMREKGKWIALGPGAIFAFEQEGIPYKIPEDFYSNQELENLCLEYHERLERFCEGMDEILQKNHPELRRIGIKPLLFYICPLTKLIDGALSRIFQLSNILKAYPEHKVWIYKRKASLWGEHDIAFSNTGSLWGQIASLPGWRFDVEFLQEREEAHLRPSLSRRVKAMQNHLMQIAKKSLKRAFDRQGKVSHGSLLFYGPLYEWRWVLPVLKERGWHAIFADSISLKIDTSGIKKSHAVDDLIMNELDAGSLFESFGISFYPLLRERIAWIFENACSYSKAIFSRWSAVIRAKGVKAILTANTEDLAGHTVEQMGRHLGIPVIHWQHGFMMAQNGRINQLNEFNDMMTSDAALTFGEGPMKAHNLYKNKFPSRAVSVGSPSLDEIWHSSRKRDEVFNKKILYVTRIYCLDRWYCSLSPIISDRTFFIDQLKVLESLKGVASSHGAEVTLKLRRRSPFHESFVSHFSSVFKIVVDEAAFKELMRENHIIVIDSPTTVMLEAAATRKPLFVLMRDIRYSDPARRMLEKRAVCVDTAQKLQSALRDYIEQRIYPADVDNDEFLKAYGSYLNDGNSARRAADQVVEAIDKNRSKKTAHERNNEESREAIYCNL